MVILGKLPSKFSVYRLTSETFVINHSKSVAQWHLGWLHSGGVGTVLLCKYHRNPDLASYSSLNLLRFNSMPVFGDFF